MDRFIIGVVNETLPGAVELANLNTFHPGFAVELTQLVCELLKLNCTFVVAPTNDYGSLDANGSWSGVLGGILEGLYNTSLPTYKSTVIRSVQFDFPYSGLYQNLNFYSRAPEITDGNVASLLSPFRYLIWITLIASLFLMSLVIFTTQHTNYSDPNWRFCTNLINFVRKTTEYFIVLLMFLVRKSPMVKFNLLPIKILLTIWGFCSIILIASYSSNLLNSMLQTSTWRPFDDFESLVNCLERKLCRLIVAPGGDAFLKDIEDSQFGTRYNQLKLALYPRNPPIRVKSVDQMITQIVETTDKFLVSWATSTNYFNGSKTDCLLSALSFGQEIRTFPFRKNDPTQFRFESTMKAIMEAGWIGYHKRANSPQIKCKQTPTNRQEFGAKPIKLSYCGSLVVISLISFAIAFMFLMLEKVESQ